MSFDVDRLKSLLKAARLELNTFKRTSHSEERWERWIHEMDAILRNDFGAESSERQQFTSAASSGGLMIGPTREVRDESKNKRFEGTLQSTSAWLDALIFQVETFGIESSESVNDVPKRYIWSSPIYVSERILSSAASGARVLRSNALMWLVAGGITLIASILAILGFTGVIDY